MTETMTKKENKIAGRYELTEQQHSDLTQIKIWMSKTRDEEKYPKPLTLNETIVEMIEQMNKIRQAGPN